MLAFSGIATPAVSISPKLPALRAAVIVPGFLSDESDFYELAEALSADGIATAVVPMKLWHWIPILGGRWCDRCSTGSHTPWSTWPRSVTLRRSAQHRCGCACPLQNIRRSTAGTTSPPIRAACSRPAAPTSPTRTRTSSRWARFRPRRRPRAQWQLSATRPAATRRASSCRTARTVAARTAAARWSTLVTLGTPHVAGAGVLLFGRVDQPRGAGRPNARGRRDGTPGATSGDPTKGAYSFCEPSGTGGEALDGDGVTTTASATTLAGAETMVLEGTTHYPWTAPGPVADVVAPELTKAYREGKPWYGSDGPRSEWVRWLKEGL